MSENPRRTFLLAQAGMMLGAGAFTQSASAAEAGPATYPLPAYARRMDHTSERQSSYDRTGGNADRFEIAPGQSLQIFQADGPGVVTHVWFTIASHAENHLKELVLRMFWDGNAKPSVEVPVGDFFGLNLGQYFLYQSAFLNCSPMKALNAYFAMPFHKSARMTVTNEGKEKVGAFYSNIDYQVVSSLPQDACYFHAQYRQAAPNVAESYPNAQSELNPNGLRNYVFMEAKGQGHLMGVTLGVVQNTDRWMGEGDDMTFVDGGDKPTINGTGTEDYFCGAWDFGGRDGAAPFANLYCGAPFIALPERTNGRYCLYRWHADNPVTFKRSLKHTIEHGHANDRGDCFYSVAYWYQSEPYTDFPALPDASSRVAVLKI